MLPTTALNVLKVKNMTSAVEYRSVIKFLVLRRTEPAVVIQQLQEVYQDKCPSRATIYNWIRDFKHGRESVFDLEREGRPPEISDEKQEMAKKIITEERRITLSELSNHLCISKGSTHIILKDLGIRKLSSRFVPRFLTAEMRECRLECSVANMQIFEEHGEKFLDNIITEDETPISLYIPESRRDSAEWKLPHETATRKLRTGTAPKRAAMMTVFWSRRGIIKVDFLDKKKTMNGAYYSELVTEVRKLRRKTSGIPLWLLHDNAPIHTCHVVNKQIEKTGFILMQHPPYSPDLAPSDFALFSRLKRALKGHQFESESEMKSAVMDFLQNLPADFFKNAFLELISRWQKCIDANGSYIEK